MSSAKPITLLLCALAIFSGCGSETSPRESVAARMQPNHVPKPDASSPRRDADNPSVQSEELSGPPKVLGNPTASELRVMREAAEVQEGKIQGLIKDLDANLRNPEIRKDAQRSFNEALPEYKANILAIGKAKLKDQSETRQ